MIFHRKRRGTSLIEMIVASGLFAMLLAAMLPLIQTTTEHAISSDEEINRAVAVKETLMNIQDEFESAIRMQGGTVNPQMLSSFSFEKPSGMTTTTPSWVQYTVSGTQLLRNGVDASLGFEDKVNATLDGTNYYKLSFFSLAGQPLASNIGSDLPIQDGVNNAMTPYWRMKLIFLMDGRPWIASAVRKETPVLAHPQPQYSAATGSYGPPYTFDVPMDTGKDNTVTWTSDGRTTNTVPNSTMSSWEGIPYAPLTQLKILSYGSAIGTFHSLTCELSVIDLSNPSSTTTAKLANKEVQLYLSYNTGTDPTQMTGVTDADGTVTFTGPIAATSNTLKFLGDKDYAPCQISN
jgi:type II secretory pathway pseudopilin PulG